MQEKVLKARHVRGTAATQQQRLSNCSILRHSTLGFLRDDSHAAKLHHCQLSTVNGQPAPKANISAFAFVWMSDVIGQHDTMAYD